MGTGTVTGKAADNERVAQQRATATAWLFFVGLHCSRKACEEVVTKFPLDFTARGELKQGADERLWDIIETCQQLIARYAPEGTLTKVLAAFTVASTAPSLKEQLATRQKVHEAHLPAPVLVGALDMLEAKRETAGERTSDPTPATTTLVCEVGTVFTRTTNTAGNDQKVVFWNEPTRATYRITSINSYQRVTARRLGDNALLTFHRDNFKAVCR